MKGEVMIVVVREGINGGPEANPVPQVLQDIPRMVQSFRVVSALDGLSARRVITGTYSATTEFPTFANWANTCPTGSFSVAFLDPLLTNDLVTVDSVFSKIVTVERHCPATTVNG